MSSPITFCELRKAIDTNKWDSIDQKMDYNRSFGAFSLFHCSCGKCKDLTKKESKIADQHLWLEEKKMTKKLKVEITNLGRPIRPRDVYEWRKERKK